MLRQLSNPSFKGRFPRQFWLMFWGLLLSTSGASMIWPFLLIYINGKLNLPLTAVSTLITINAVCSVLATFLAGSIADRLGRKGVMVISLFADAALFVWMIQADDYLTFAMLMAARGFSNPLYRVGADAMLADLVPSKDRPEAYALVRMASNLGIAIGPAVGGFLAATSYALAFYAAASGMALYGLLLAFFGRETLQVNPQETRQESNSWLGGYDKVLKDKAFTPVIGMMMFGWVTAVLMWILMPIYAKDNFGVPENFYGWIPTTNALLVVSLQIFVTRRTRHYETRRMMSLGMLFYAIANGLVALATGFWGFWFAMVIMTIGELIIVPTSSTYVANIAPAAMRGRYMSIYGLTWSFGQMVGPVLGGLLNDNFGPVYIWIGGLAIGLVSAFGLYLLSRRVMPQPPSGPSHF
jgi:MFS family permease